MVKKVFKKERKKASRSFIYKSLKLESTQMTIVIKMDQKMWHIIQSNKKEWTIDTHNKRDGSLRCNVKQKKKKASYRRVHIIRWLHQHDVERQAKLINDGQAQNNGYPWQRRLTGKGHRRAFQGTENILYLVLDLVTWAYRSVCVDLYL